MRSGFCADSCAAIVGRTTTTWPGPRNEIAGRFFRVHPQGDRVLVAIHPAGTDSRESVVRISAFQEAVEDARLDQPRQAPLGSQFRHLAIGALVKGAPTRAARAIHAAFWRRSHRQCIRRMAAVSRCRKQEHDRLQHGGAAAIILCAAYTASFNVRLTKYWAGFLQRTGINMNRHGWALLGLAAFATATLAGAAAQSADRSFPNKAVRIIVGFVPGGSADGSARLIAEKMSEEWKQPVIVENKPGAGTTIAATYVAGSPPDGYTLLLIGPASHAVSSALYRNLPYDALKSFAGVGQVASAPFVVVVNPATKINTMKELIELARSKPGQVSYSSSGSGASPHLATEMIAMATGIKLLHVPFKGASPATLALLGAQVDFSVADSSVIPFVQSAKLRALAVTTASQSPLFPGVPTLAEAGVPGVEVPLATGILAPAGTPREVILKINAAMTRAVGVEDVRRRLNALGFESAPKSPEEFSVFLASEVQKYTKIVNAIGLKID